MTPFRYGLAAAISVSAFIGIVGLLIWAAGELLGQSGGILFGLMLVFGIFAFGVTYAAHVVDD